MAQVKFRIEGDLLAKAHELAEKFSKFELWGNSQWRKGLLNSNTDKFRTEFVGICGEIAFSQISGLPLDEEVRAHGNDKDFVLPADTHQPLRIDVKTNAKQFREFFIKAIDGKGRRVELKSHVYVFAYLEQETDTYVDVVISGFVTKEYIENNCINKERPALKGAHKNYYFEPDKLNDVNKLFKLFDALKVCNAV